MSATEPLLASRQRERNVQSTKYPWKTTICKKNQKIKTKQNQKKDIKSVHTSILIRSREEVFKFIDRLGGACGFIQVFLVSHSPYGEAVSVCVCLADFNARPV